MWKSLFFALFVALLPVIWVQSNRIFALDKDVVYHHNEKCKKHNTLAPLVDFAEVDSDELIALEIDLHALLFVEDPSSVKPGRLLKVLDLGYASPKFIEIERKGHPEDVAFHPFGIYFQDNTIYVLNQALNKGGPRVEIYSYASHKAIYQGAVLLDPELGTTFNDLIIHESSIYLSQYTTTQLSNTGQVLTLSSAFSMLLTDIVQDHNAKVYKCPLNVGEKVCCRVQSSGKSASVTGITKDRDNLVYVSFSSIDFNWIEFYSINTSGDLEYEEKLAIRDRAEKLTYSHAYDKVYGAAVPWPKRLIYSDIVPSGALEIYKPVGGSYVNRRLYMQERDLKGASASARIGNYIITGSAHESAALVCPIVGF